MAFCPRSAGRLLGTGIQRSGVGGGPGAGPLRDARIPIARGRGRLSEDDFTAPAGEGRLKLRFEGVYSGAEVWVNGRRLAYHEGGALPFEVDITDAVHSRDNLLAVRVTQQPW